MHTLRIFSLWVLCLLCITAVSGTVYLATVSTTLFDRQDVKEWLNTSGIYDNNTLISSLFAPQADTPSQAATGTTEQAIITSEAIKNALGHVFPAQFLKHSFTIVVDKSYDWIEGKSANFSFSIPIDAKRQIFIAELVKEVEPRVAALPRCSFNTPTVCRPDIPIAEFTRQLVTESLAASDFLEAPITETTFSSAASSQDLSSLSQLPKLHTAVNLLLWILPVVFIITLLSAWGLTEHGRKLTLLSKLSRGVLSSMTLASVLAGTIIIIEKLYGLPIESALPQFGALAPIVARFMTAMILTFCWTLLLYAAVPLALSLIGWIIFARLKKRRTPTVDLPSDMPPSQPPLSSAI